MTQLKVGDNWNGSSTYVKEEDGALYASDIQDARVTKAILDNNQRMRSLGRDPNPTARGRMVASVPVTIHYEWQKEWKRYHSDKWTWKTFVAMKLNDSNWAKLRTNEMKV